LTFHVFGHEFGLGSPSPRPHPALDALMAEAAAHRSWYQIRRSNQLEAGRALLAAPPAEQAAVVPAALARMARLGVNGEGQYAQKMVLGKLISDLLRRELPFGEADIVIILRHASDLVNSYGMLPIGSIVKTAEGFVRRFGLSDDVRKALEGLLRGFGPKPSRQDERKLRARVQGLLGTKSELELKEGDPWADAVTASLAAMPDGERSAWGRLLAHAQAGTGSAPSQAWRKAATPLVTAVGAERLAGQVIEWLAHAATQKDIASKPPTPEDVARASRDVADTLLADLDVRARTAWWTMTEMIRTRPASPDAAWYTRFQQLVAAAGGSALLARVTEQVRALTVTSPTMPERNADTLRGLVWMCALLPEDGRLAGAMGDLGLRCLKKVPNYGAYSSKVGHACIWVLGELSGMEPVAQLGRLKQHVKYPVSLRLVDKAIAAAASRASISPEELEEMAVPAYGLTEPGQGRATVGEFTATLRVGGTDDVEMLWTDRAGRAQKTVPAEVRRLHADELKQLKRGLKDITTVLPAQRDRMERLFTADRHWKLAEWRARYLDHPLLSVITRRLIWHFKEADDARLGIFHEGHIVGIDTAPISLGDRTEVRLWHPLGFPPETVLAWRTWLREHEVRQPFKQAHREIYVLTDAELQTSSYSNRFAAHIIRQHQFAALCRERSWRYHLQGDWDSHNVPRLPLPRFGLQAEFWVEPLVPVDNEQSGMGIYLQIATDQVRFSNPDGTPRQLSEVPAILFSEVMRDVDLFVGVASIGADPTWMDRGDERTRTYWQGYAFGELGETAATRRDVLASLLPQLKIAPQCALEGRFLHVQGKLRRYKIHLGSANILMEPNDQYLCIVPDRRPTGSPTRDLVLPFEGDNTLAVIVSKAMMLANDDRITDETILRQIR
jgi:hypothetical protein